MYDVPTLTDGVVTLRAHHDGDIDRAVEQSRDPLSIQWTTVPTPYTRDDAVRFLRQAMPGGWGSDEEWGFAVEFEGAYGGTVSLRNRGPGRAEIAYGSHPDVRGRGVMERALRLLLDWGFSAEGRDLETVIWYANEGNWASRRLAWKVGFSFDGTLRGWLDHRGEATNAWAGTLRRGEAMEPRNEWMEVPRIVGERVVLRRHEEKDRERLIEGANDPGTQEWIYRIPMPYTEKDGDDFFRLRDSAMATGTGVHWVMADPETDDFAGLASIVRIERPTGELGYWTHPGARGRGMTLEAARLMARHAFIDREDGGLGLTRLCLNAAVGNAGSNAIAERVGFTRIGTERGGPWRRVDGTVVATDCNMYDLLADEFTY